MFINLRSNIFTEEIYSGLYFTSVVGESSLKNEMRFARFVHIYTQLMLAKASFFLNLFNATCTL